MTKYLLMKPHGADPFAVLSDDGEILWSSQPGIDTMLTCPTEKALALPCLPITGRWIAGSKPDVVKLCADARASGVKTLGQILKRKAKAREPLRAATGPKRKPTTHGRANLAKGPQASAAVRRKITDEDLQRAREYRAQGIAWPLIGKALKVNPESLRKASQRQAITA